MAEITARSLLVDNQITLRKALEAFMLEAYQIKISARSTEKLIFDFHEPVTDKDPYHYAVFLINDRVGYRDLIGYLLFDFANYEFEFFPKYKSNKIIIQC